jgi:phage terminase Nu1 subunit (DNA packaging protein)
MWRVGHPPYRRTMRDHRRLALVRHPSVTIEAAAELNDIDVATVRGWANEGVLVIEQRGDMEVVQLEEVKALAARRRATKRGGLLDRLADSGETPAGEVVNIADLQVLARERTE